ncbi:alaserpin-like isoform X2 [Zophobas morio]|uniref:alaserpin-like isoform X2 n=1 Tax=Zophobas morio TaxID=2755281 RepID=UPI0030827577
MVLKTAEALQVSDSSSQFTNNLYNVLAETSPGNIIFSPINLHAVLSMVYQGAQGTTAEKFASSLKVPEAKIARDGYSVIMQRLISVPKVSILIANKVYLMEGPTLLPDFSEAVTKDFLSDVQLLNFGDQTAAAATINTWVEEKTQEKIKDLVKEEDLNESTRLVLVNAIYFKATWMYVFDEATITEPFYLNDVDSVNVPMMHMRKTLCFNIFKDLEAKMRDGIAELEKKLATVNLAKITSKVYNQPVTLTLPKFKFEQTIDLEDSLTKLGLGEIYDRSAANFSGMITSKEPLHVSKVIQKVFFQVNEDGSDAPPTPAISGRRDGWYDPERNITITADRPFLFVLLEKSTGTHILFSGKIMNPLL